MCLLSMIKVTQPLFFFFFLNDPATPEIYTLSLHAPLPIFDWNPPPPRLAVAPAVALQELLLSGPHRAQLLPRHRLQPRRRRRQRHRQAQPPGRRRRRG